MKRNHRVVFIFLLSFLSVLGMLTWIREHANRSPSPDSLRLAPGTALDMLYDAKLGNFSLKPSSHTGLMVKPAGNFLLTAGYCAWRP